MIVLSSRLNRDRNLTQPPYLAANVQADRPSGQGVTREHEVRLL